MNLRQRLKRSGITLKDLSKQTAISESTVCHVLNENLVRKVKFAAELLIAERIAEATAESGVSIETN